MTWRAFYEEDLGVALGGNGSSGWATARCFANRHLHRNGDTNRSTSVNLDSGWWRCHGCDEGGSGFEAALHCGIPFAEIATLMEAHEIRTETSNANNPKPTIVEMYEYVDEKGGHLFEVVRYEPKAFRQRRLDPKHPDSDRDGYVWSVGGIRRPLYRLDRVVRAIRDDQPIFVAEGEKDVHALEGAGVAATCNPMGAGKWRPEHTETLRGAKVIIVADRDPAGLRHAQSVAQALNGVATSVRIVWAAEGKDAHDHFSAGKNLDDFVEVALDHPLHPDDVSAPEAEEVPGEDGALLLDEVRTFVRGFVVMADEQADVVALWTMQAHAIDAAADTPRLHVRSPEKESGKTRVLELLVTLVPRPMHNVIPTEAVLFRSISAERPTLLIDEVDTIFGPKAGEREGVRAVLNAGYREGATVPRMVPDGKGYRVEHFAVFCAVALAGIGDIPDTIASRSIPIRLKRRAKDEPIGRFRRSRDERLGNALRGRLAAWAKRRLSALKERDPEMPLGLSDRAEDIWAPLLAIADEAGGTWPERARRAATTINGCGQSDDSLGVRLLRDIRTVFTTKDDRMPSAAIVAGLLDVETGPWNDLNGKPMDPRILARFLRPYDITPIDIKIEGKARKGYMRRQFHDAWNRYCPDPISPFPVPSMRTAMQVERNGAAPADALASATPRHPISEAGSDPFRSATDLSAVAANEAARMASTLESRGIADLLPPEDREACFTEVREIAEGYVANRVASELRRRHFEAVYADLQAAKASMMADPAT